MSLHRALTLFMVVIAVVALSAAVSLVLLTTHLHRATLDLEAGLHSVRLAEEMQIDLLEHARSKDPKARTLLEGSLRQKLVQARAYVNAVEEEAALNEASRFIENEFPSARGVQAQTDGENLERSFSALRRFVDINVEQAERSLQQSERWDEMGNWIGTGAGIALAVGVGAMLVWIRVFAFRPVFEICYAMNAFGANAKDARAPERGPEELRIIAAQFNDMANTLVRQHDDQLTFLAAVAHDLRNPLSALKLSADILSSGRPVPSEKVSELMAVVRRQVYQLDRMVGDLLDRTRIEGGHLELRLKEHDARSIAQDAFDLFSSASDHHRLILKLPNAPIIVSCDALRVEQVLNNLISNAIKYSPNGGDIELSVDLQGNDAVFRVSDHGMGIPEHELTAIFAPFRRIRPSKEEIPGVGLGLSVALRIVQAHTGRIEARSEVGKGTTFRVYLPAISRQRHLAG